MIHLLMRLTNTFMDLASDHATKSMEATVSNFANEFGSVTSGSQHLPSSEPLPTNEGLATGTDHLPREPGPQHPVPQGPGM